MHSDYWGLISSLPDAHFLVMIERKKCGPDMKEALADAGIFYCYLNLLLEQSRENQRLHEQLQAAQAALADKAICIDQAGSIAEASLQLNGIFQAAERACQQYTENIVRLSQHQQVICAQREKESQEKALQIVADAQKQAEDATTAAQKQCDEMLKKAKAESQAYWDAVSAKITSITNEHAELRQLFSQISAREKDKQL